MRYGATRLFDLWYRVNGKYLSSSIYISHFTQFHYHSDEDCHDQHSRNVNCNFNFTRLQCFLKQMRLTTRFEAINKANDRSVLQRTFNKRLALLPLLATDSEAIVFHHVRHGTVLDCTTRFHTILNSINHSFIGKVTRT